MNPSSSKLQVTQAPYWKKTAPLMAIAFTLTDEQRKTLRLSSMRMRGFRHAYQRDVETNETKVFSKNPNKVVEDLKALFPELEVCVKRVFIPFRGSS